MLNDPTGSSLACMAPATFAFVVLKGEKSPGVNHMGDSPSYMKYGGRNKTFNKDFLCITFGTYLIRYLLFFLVIKNEQYV